MSHEQAPQDAMGEELRHEYRIKTESKIPGAYYESRLRHRGNDKARTMDSVDYYCWEWYFKMREE